jgi:NAD(P)-dependent dehydrogenase (short-subunit alcohol dehydrogenase family)
MTASSADWRCCDRVAVVTRGAAGIGRGIVELFLEHARSR